MSVNRCPYCSTAYPNLQPRGHTRCLVCEALTDAKLDEAASRLLADLAESASALPEADQAAASQLALERGAAALLSRARNVRRVAHTVQGSLEPHRRRRQRAGDA